MAQFDSILEKSIIAQNDFDDLVDGSEYDVIDIIGGISDDTDANPEDLETLDINKFIEDWGET